MAATKDTDDTDIEYHIARLRKNQERKEMRYMGDIHRVT
jgi:hypothetical protein